VTVFAFAIKEGVAGPTAAAIASVSGVGNLPGAKVQIDAAGAFTFQDLAPGEYLLGWQWQHPLPEVARVQKGDRPGWGYADARYGDVSDVHVAVPGDVWRAAGIRRSRDR
jgi:hypothetical protein